MTTITLGGSNLSTEEQEIEAARELRAQAREKLRKDRKRHELTKKRKQVKETAASS